MPINNEVISEASKYVAAQLKEKLPEGYTFHNIAHTMNVVRNAALIAEGVKVKEADRNLLITAAWFHDIGYITGTEKHERKSAAMAEEFLNSKGIENGEIEAVKRCILATEFPQQPANLIGEILCDADMVHLADKMYDEKLDGLRKEWEVVCDRVYSEEEWLAINYDFLMAHSYFTSFCRENFEKPKRKNLKKIQARLDAIRNGEPLEDPDDNDEKKEKKEDKQDKLQRGVETMFRTTSRNHMDLSGMADSKANILISINALIISIVLSVLVTKLDNFPGLIIPTAILVAVCVTTIIMAVLATRPKVSGGSFTKQQIHKREINLLFFGNFHKVPLEDYQWAIREMMYDKNYLYESMVKDIYFLGKVLARKYRLINKAYTVFMFGLVVAVLAFAISFFFFNPNR